MRNYKTERDLRIVPMVLVLVIALIAIFVVGNLRAQAHTKGEEIPTPRTIERTTSDLVRNDEPAVYTIVAEPAHA